LVQTWPTNLNEKFRQDFEISEGANPDLAKFQPQAVSEFQDAMARLFGPTAASCRIMFCHKKLVSTSPAVVGPGEEVLAHIKKHPVLMHELAIASIDSDSLGFVADGTNGKGQQIEKNFRLTPGEQCVVYRKTGCDTMGCIKPLKQFLSDAEFHELPTLDHTAEESAQQQDHTAEESAQQQEQGSQDEPETEGAMFAQSTPEEPLPWEPTQPWLHNVKKKLKLQAVLCLVNHLGPKIEAIARTHDITGHDEVIKYIRQTTMVGILPVPHPISIRTYQASNYTAMWFTSYMWGVIFSRSQRMPMYDWTKIRLVPISN